MILMAAEKFAPFECMIGSTVLQVVLGDIAYQNVDAVVNAARNNLGGGGGVDGAIHEAAGVEELQAACREIGYCATGNAVITPGFNLKARFIVHTVGPKYIEGPVNKLGQRYNRKAPRLLSSCYRRSLVVAAEHGVRSIAFPAISTGAFNYPADRATKVAVVAVRDFVSHNPETFCEIRFVAFDDDMFAIYKRTLREHGLS